MIKLLAGFDDGCSVEEHTLSSTSYLVLVFVIKSTYHNLLWKTAVFLNVIFWPEISIGKYVNGKTI
jgi:hypothetical protein